jgi:hypothetical protein
VQRLQLEPWLTGQERTTLSKSSLSVEGELTPCWHTLLAAAAMEAKARQMGTITFMLADSDYNQATFGLSEESA